MDDILAFGARLVQALREAGVEARLRPDEAKVEFLADGNPAGEVSLPRIHKLVLDGMPLEDLVRMSLKILREPAAFDPYKDPLICHILPQEAVMEGIIARQAGPLVAETLAVDRPQYVCFVPVGTVAPGDVDRLWKKAEATMDSMMPEGKAFPLPESGREARLYAMADGASWAWRRAKTLARAAVAVPCQDLGLVLPDPDEKTLGELAKVAFTAFVRRAEGGDKVVSPLAYLFEDGDLKGFAAAVPAHAGESH